MYKVLVDGTLLCDSRIEELALINPVVKLEENKAGSFSFKIPPAHPYYDAIQRRKSVIQVYQDDNEEPLFSGICTKETKDFYKQKTIECEGELTYLNDSIQRPARYEGKTVRGLLETYIANHNAQVEDAKKFSVGMVNVEDANDYISCFTNMETTMKAIKEDLVDDLGGLISTRYADGVKYIDYLADSINTNSQIIKIGKNLMDFTTNMDATDIATAIIPQGVKLAESAVEGLETRLTIESVNDGLDYVHSAEAVETYGWIYKTVTWDNVTTPEALKAKAEKYLSDIQFENMVIQAKAVDLHLTNKDIEQFKISDQIRVVSAPHGLDRYFRLTKMTINLNNPEKDTVTLGKEEMASLSAKTNQANDAVKKAIESIVPASSIIQQAVANATQLIQNATNGYITTVMNEYGTPKELLIMDTPSKETATKVWRWNINGLGHSSTGYNGEYGLAITMDGQILGDKIKAKSISSEQLAVQYVEDGQISSQISAEKDAISIKGNRIEIESDNFKLSKDGTVSATGEFNTTKETEASMNAQTRMTGVGVSVYRYADTEEEADRVRVATLNAVVGEKNGVMILYRSGYPDVAIAAGAGRGVQIRDGSQGENAVAALYRDSTVQCGALKLACHGSNGWENYFFVGFVGGNYQMNFGNWAFSKNTAWLNGKTILNNTGEKNIGYFGEVQTDNLTASDKVQTESLTVNQMGVNGGAIQPVEWVYNEQMQRWCLCTIT